MPSSSEDLSDRRKLAIIIGNDNYSEKINKLDQSVKNANDLANLLSKIKFQVKAKANISSGIMEQIQDLINEFTIQDGDLILFYFSGHACQSNGKNYLIPTDDTRVVDTNDVEVIGTEVERILDRLMKKGSSCVVIFILDCCRPYKLKSASTSNAKGLAELRRRPGMFIQFACDANQTVNDNLFGKHLLRKIDTRNKSVVKIFQDISNDVYTESNHTQKPLSINGLEGLGEVFLSKVSTLPEIPVNAVWKCNALTVAGGKGRGNTLNRLNSPKGVTIDEKGNILIADSLNHRIVNYKRNTTTGRRIAGRNIDGYESDMLYRPLDVTFDTNPKNLIICDYYNRRMLQLALGKTTFTKKILENVNCFGLAMDDEGSLYVSNTELHEVRRYLPGEKYGTVVAGGNGQGSRLQQLNHPTYICIGNDQSVYVSDSWNDRVMRWDKGARKGVVVAGGNGKGKRRTQLDHPTGVLVDSLDTVYVADHGNGRVMRWCNGASQGDIIAGDKFLLGDQLNELNGPEGLAFDKFNNLYVADSNNYRIQKFDIEET